MRHAIAALAVSLTRPLADLPILKNKNWRSSSRNTGMSKPRKQRPLGRKSKIRRNKKAIGQIVAYRRTAISIMNSRIGESRFPVSPASAMAPQISIKKCRTDYSERKSSATVTFQRA
jgi:hypothetical protein